MHLQGFRINGGNWWEYDIAHQCYNIPKGCNYLTYFQEILIYLIAHGYYYTENIQLFDLFSGNSNLYYSSWIL